MFVGCVLLIVDEVYVEFVDVFGMVGLIDCYEYVGILCMFLKVWVLVGVCIGMLLMNDVVIVLLCWIMLLYLLFLFCVEVVLVVLLLVG